MYYQFSQTNSFGRFHYHDAGVSAHVIIEARDAEEANHRAEELGLYFDGFGDCLCCGNRWDARPSYDEGHEVPSYCGAPITSIESYRWPNMGSKPEMFIHHLNGDVDAVVIVDDVPQVREWSRKATPVKKTKRDRSSTPQREAA